MALDDNEFFAGYIEEVQTYIPQIAKGIEDLQTADNKREIFSELYRLVHIIKGASSMVGITGLSQIAGCMEDALENIQEGRLALTPEAFDAMRATTERFNQYCISLQKDLPIDEELLLSKTLDDFSKLGTGSGVESITLFSDPLEADEDSLLSDFSSSEEPDEELLREFRAEAEEHLESLYQSLEYLDQAITQQMDINDDLREIVRKVRRSVHTIKGASAVIGLTSIAAYGHLVEDVLDWLFESAVSIEPDFIQKLAESLDLLATLVYNPADFEEQRAEDVLAALNAFIAESGTVDEAQGPDIFSEAEEQVITLPEEFVGSSEKVTVEPKPSTSPFTEEEKLLLHEGFLEEAEEHLQQLHQSMQILEEEITESSHLSETCREEVRKVRRAVHTVKGASAVIGFSEIASYAHGVEDFLDWLYEKARQTDPLMINTLSESLGLLGQLIDSPDSVSQERQDDIHKRLLDYTASTENEPALEGQAGFDLDEDVDSSMVTMEPPWAASSQETVIDDLDIPSSHAEAAKTIRINQLQLDNLINLSNELLVGISGFDQDMGLFKNALEELELTARRLKDIALELETKFEVKALDQMSEHFLHLDNAIQDVKRSESFAEFDALELDRYTQLNLIIRSLNESTIDVSAIHTNLAGVFSGIGGDISRQHRVIRELQVQMMRTRMSPMSTLSSRLSRTMRDVASRLGKKVRLAVHGEQVELDRVVWEKLADPFMHLVRNAIHHGIESGEERESENKPAIATITLEGRREGNNIAIRFSDDGRGLDFDAIRQKARQLGLADKIDQMDKNELIDLIFYPGFSTKSVSEISGRGVGMDVVRENVKELQGTIVVETEPGAGTTFVIRVPLTLGVVRALLVRINDVTYGIPLNDIQDIRRVEKGDIDFDAGLLQIGERNVPWYSLPALLGLGEKAESDERPLMLMLTAENRTLALSIPHISGQKEVVVKGLGTHLKAVSGITGAAVMGDGSVVPVLDVPELAQAGQRAERAATMSLHMDAPKVLSVMIVDDSISIRRVMSRLVTASGWLPVEAKDGMDAVELLEMGEAQPDCIVLDVEMPRMNGFEFLAKLPHVSGGQNIPVIMLTSRTSSKHKEKALQLGASAFLNKPCKDEEFVETVSKLTKGKTDSRKGIETNTNRSSSSDTGKSQAKQQDVLSQEHVPLTVMLVDDSISIRRVMSRFISAPGWTPIEAKDGLDAVEQLEQGKAQPDCIVLDIEMPRMNGFEFLAKKTHIEGAKNIPVIVLSSRTSPKHIEKALGLGAKLFLHKPCKEEELIEAVESLVKKARIEQEVDDKETA